METQHAEAALYLTIFWACWVQSKHPVALELVIYASVLLQANAYSSYSGYGGQGGQSGELLLKFGPN